MFKPSVSIVVNTYNRANDLPNTLRSLGHLDHDNYEVIVVNGPSTDDTETILDQWSNAIKILRCPQANLSISRNVGIAAAAGDIVAFIDDDAVPHPQWITRLSHPYADPRTGAVGGFTVDNTGDQFQCQKTICDRSGSAYYVSEYFDERALNKIGSPYYPSLLGTNSSFRRSVLQEIGGFDDTFAYFLDETDVCLRIVDAGYKVLYEPSALVFHQFSPSHIRTKSRVPRTLYPSSVSKSYFIMRHAAALSVEDAGRNMSTYRNSILDSNRWLAENNEITLEHRVSLDQDLMAGIAEGTKKAFERGSVPHGQLQPIEAEPLKQFPQNDFLTIALVSQGFPPSSEAGIARWTWMAARGLAARGHAVHVITRAAKQESRRFESGYWIHEVADNPVSGQVLAARLGIPANLAARAAAVRDTVAFLKTFGLDLLSFPIWDLEGIACVDDDDLSVVMTLHTSYGLAKPHKKEWTDRPLYEHFFVNKVIAAETRLLTTVPKIIANSKAIISDLTLANQVEFSDRTELCPHGTTDPFVENDERRSLRDETSDVVRIVFAGRFEPRKGFDIAAKVLARILRRGAKVRIDFAGDQLSGATVEWLKALDASDLVENPAVHFVGFLTRGQLDDLYASADVVFMPSRYESFGLVAIEAMAAGAPVVGLACGGLAEVIENGVSGITVPVDGNEVDNCYKALNQLIRDRERLRKLGSGARRSYEQKYTIDCMVDALESAYVGVVVKRNLGHA